MHALINVYFGLIHKYFQLFHLKQFFYSFLPCSSVTHRRYQDHPFSKALNLRKGKILHKTSYSQPVVREKYQGVHQIFMSIKFSMKVS